MADAALAVVGARFRLHGRDPATGLDCVGLVAVALRGGGYSGAVPNGYALRGGDPAVVMRALDRVLVWVDREAPGDVLVMTTGPGQLHLGVRTVRGIVNADAGLRRVVERPGAAGWPVIGAWALPDEWNGRDVRIGGDGHGDAGVDDGGECAGRAYRGRYRCAAGAGG